MKLKGRQIVLSIGNGDEVNETFAVIATLNSKSISIGNAGIDVTTPDAADPGGKLWRETLDGLRNVDISGSGITSSQDEVNTLLAVSQQTDPTRNFQALIPEMGTFAGKFRLTQFEVAGEATEASTFNITLESTGEVTYTPAV